MLAAFVTGREKVEVREAPVPSPGPGEVMLRVRVCGICGSDLHFYHGQLPAAHNVPVGHEFSGEVARLGDGVSGFTEGQRVVAEPVGRCGECVYCRTGRYHLCPGRTLLGTFVPGGMAEYVCVPAAAVYPLPDDLDLEVGALAEPLAVAVHGLHIVDLKIGERVLVMGSGAIGLLTIMAARAAGAGQVVATYRHEHQGQAALAAGADRILKDDQAGELGSDAIDVAVETVGGGAPTLTQATGIVRAGGRVSLLGVFTQPVPFNALAVALREVSIVGGITYCRPGQQSDFDVALSILRADPERARAIITHHFPLAEAASAFATAADKKSGSLKVHVAP